MLDIFNMKDQVLLSALVNIADAIEDIENWSVYNGDVELLRIIEFKKNYLDLAKRLEGSKGGI